MDSIGLQQEGASETLAEQGDAAQLENSLPKIKGRKPLHLCMGMKPVGEFIPRQVSF
ncbi:hypothetical protein NUACC21_45570 [Scytonema sp. NUACC21]